MRFSRRRQSTVRNTVPAVLPQVVVRPDEDDTLTINVAGQPSASGPMPRATLGRALADIAEQAGGPIRVEVHEPDGSRHADIITPPPAPDDHSPRPVQKRPRRRRGVKIDASGFLPGETVLVAITVRTETADHTGHVTARLDHRVSPTGAAEVLLFGAVSGALHVAEPV